MADEIIFEQANQEPAGECEPGSRSCSGRREFLVRALSGAGGLVLALSVAGCGGRGGENQGPGGGPPGGRQGRRPGGPGGGPGGGGAPEGAATVQGDEVVLKVDASSPLQKVGGAQTVETPSGKIVVARTGESSFVAVSAVCTHKNGPINYDSAQKQFFCPLHGSRFGLDGSVQRPPANGPLQAYTPRPDVSHKTVTISLKPA